MPATVSIIVPCYNEQATIRTLLDALYAQTYPRVAMEVVIADGLSEDNTRDEIAAFQREYPDLAIEIVENEDRIIPAGLNCALGFARGEIIVRVDAHAAPSPDYVERSVTALEDGKGDNVGGVWDIRPSGDGWIAESIAAAAAHPLGVGDALYRHATQAQKVDTVPFGAFHHTLLEKVGLFDETLLANEDYEFNARIRQIGGRIWLDPAIRSVYFARATLKALSRQYWRYGFWKWRMLRRYPKTLRWRQALPPLFVLSILGGLALALFVPFVWYFLLAELAIYSLILFLAALRTAVRESNIRLAFGLPLAITTMHFSWGSGFLWSLLSDIIKARRND